MIQEITERLNVKMYHETGKLKVFKKKDFEERTNYTTQKNHTRISSEHDDKC